MGKNAKKDDVKIAMYHTSFSFNFFGVISLAG